MSGVSLDESTVFQGRYKIVRKLGEGGMGSIYLAEQTDADRIVAIKLLHPSLIENDEFRKRFIRECANLSKLSNDHIITFYNAAITERGQPYAVFEYLTGVTLRRALQESAKLGLTRTLKIFNQICKAIDAAHAQGIIHRDLKPENVMLVDKPEPDWVKVLDFGLSKESITDERESQRLTLTGDLVGTADYMSPEQCAGRKSDARSDFYAIGCMLYECIAGKKLFEAENTMSLIHQHASASALPAIDALAAECPPSMLQLLNDLLQKDPDKRPQSISKIIDDLKQVESDIQAGIKSSNKLSAPRKSSRAALIAAVCFTALIGIIAISGIIASQQATSTKSHTKKQTKQLSKQLKDSKNSARLLDLLDEAKEAAQAGDFKQACELYKQCVEITEGNPTLIEQRIKALIMLTQSTVTGQLGDGEQYLEETQKAIESDEFANASLKDRKKSKRKLDYLMNAAMIYSQKGKYDKSIKAAEEYKQLSQAIRDDTPRMYMSVLIAESGAYKGKANFEKSLELDKETLQRAQVIGEAVTDIMSTAYSSMMVTSILMKKPTETVGSFAQKYSQFFEETYNTSRFRNIFMLQALDCGNMLIKNAAYIKCGMPVLKATWNAARIDNDLGSPLRLKALHQYLLAKKLTSQKVSKPELMQMADVFLTTASEAERSDRSAMYDSMQEAAKSLEDYAKQVGDSSLSEKINLASKKL